MRLRWTPQSLRDLAALLRFIASDNPEAARAWVSKLRARARAAAAAPLVGRVVPEVGLPEVREVLHRGYRIVYRVTKDELQVLTVFEGHRLLQTNGFETGRVPK